MKSNRRVGVLTLGLSLFIFGIMFFIRTINEGISFESILKFWPLILILLGIEVLISYFTNKEESYKLDVASVFILIGMFIFASGMAVIEQVVVNLEYIIR